jgi:hypothetical protein
VRQISANEGRVKKHSVQKESFTKHYTLFIYYKKHVPRIQSRSGKSAEASISKL